MEGKLPHFEIGLVMAGAVSAGAYTSGVIDFIFEALDQWYEQKAKQQEQYGDDFSQWEIPPHDIFIKAMSGASAGAIVAAITASSLSSDIIPVISNPLNNPVKNKLYESWVQRIDISELLKAEDLDNPKAPVLSFLDSTILDELGKDVLNIKSTGKKRPYIDDPFEIYVCVTNLRGVPYLITSEAANSSVKGLTMVKHADFMHFAIGEKSGEIEDAIALSPDKSDIDNWKILINSALASSAFPVGFPPRQLERASIDEYEKRKWAVPTRNPMETGTCLEYRSISPDKDLVTPGSYQFMTVDGGIISNEPIELVRLGLRGHEERNPRDGDQANRATLLIDPFPNDVDAVNPESNLVNLVSRIFTSFINQNRFKPDELILALDEDVYSRFLIAPERSDEQGRKPLACGSLNAFGGFLSQEFRHHDYVLGRRNCQRFLEKYFVLPASNPLFNSWSEALKINPQLQVEKEGKKETFLPIIPLVGSVKKEIKLPNWPKYQTENFKSLEKQIEERVKIVIPRLINQSISDPFTRTALNVLWFFKRGSLAKKIRDIIHDNLEKYGQL
ncbi:patatin-like phospholipase family protein [Nostoc sp. C117]|uniref:patatin-like phospholipase family protein n=1 Tax=Nostoc sp. C117 TaxID=3349875 RepID=UPI00370D82CD